MIAVAAITLIAVVIAAVVVIHDIAQGDRDRSELKSHDALMRELDGHRSGGG